MFQLAAPATSVMSVEGAQSALQAGGRFLLTLSMTFFLSYLVFMIGAVVLAALTGMMKAALRRTRPGRLTARRQPVIPAERPRGDADAATTLGELRVKVRSQ